MKRSLAALLIAVVLAGAFPWAPSPRPRDGPPGAAAGNAASLPVPFVDLNVRTARNNQEVVLSVQLLLLLTVLALAPSILILTTSFLRIAIVFDFIRRALSLQTSPPNQVLMGLALFLTMFIMWPTLTDIYQNSLKPFGDGKIGLAEMYSNAEKPLRTFMFNQMGNDADSIRLFMSMRGLPKPNDACGRSHLRADPRIRDPRDDGGIQDRDPICSYRSSSSTWWWPPRSMSMGMIMLPPVMISTPFKLILFVLVNGWGMLTEQLIRSFK